MIGWTTTLNEPSVAVWTVPIVRRPLNDGTRSSVIVTDSFDWPLATPPNRFSARPYTTVDCPGCSEMDFGGVLATTAVSREPAEAEPELFDARTRTRSRLPTSADVSVYVLLVAPTMFAQLVPFVEHRRHW